MLAEFHFLRPEWLWSIPALLSLVAILAKRRLGPGSWQRVVAPPLVPFVLSAKQLKGSAYRWWLMLVGGLFAITALAGPAWNRIEQPVFRSEQAVVIALDLSRSMDAQDVAPSRLTRARLKILDIIAERASGQTALVVFSSNAFTVTPLTTDTDTIAALVNSLSTDIMPSRGSYPAAAIAKGHQLLQQAGVGFGEVLLISDGGTSTLAEKAAQDLVASGYTLSVLGVGTTGGAPIPRAGGGFVTDRSGNIAVPRLEPDQLKSLAEAGNGRYVQMTSDNGDIDYLMSDAVGQASGAGQSLATDQWKDEGPWLLVLLLPIAALAFRRGLIFCLLILLLPVTEPAYALSWDDLWLNKNQQGHRKLGEDLPGEASQLFDDEQWRAVSNYEAGEYPPSAAGFAENEDATSLYNLGNALAKMGSFETAIDAYDRALEIDPGDDDTVYNRELVARLLEQQRQQQSEQENGQQSDSESEGQSQQQDSESQSDQQSQDSSSGDPSGETQEGESSREDSESSEEDLQAMQEELRRAAEEARNQQGEEAEQESAAESQAEAEARRRAQEQTQAMEQWLRRVENDPGGLLRRKFRYQYQRQGMDQDGNSVWPDDATEPW